MRRGALLGLPLGAAAALTGLSAVFVRRLISPVAGEGYFLTPWELGIPFEEVEFSTPDGVTLRGWWLPRQDAQRTVITMAGYQRWRIDTLGISSGLWRRGCNVLMFDYRGCGMSDPHVITLGYYETVDALAAVEYAHSRRPELPVGILGYSMGGAVAIMAGARDERLKAVVADSPFASQRQVIRRNFRAHTGLPYFPAAYMMERFLPYNVDEVEPIREIGRISPRAVMLVHGSSDTITDPLDSAALYEAAGEPKEMWALPSVGHCGAYFVDRQEYIKRVASFLERYLVRDGQTAAAAQSHLP